MPRPLVSVVTASYNPESFLLEALDSVAAQTYRPVETILVNDGSDDPAGQAILREAARRVDRYIDRPHLGVSAARNAGFRAASGHYLLPLDHDDRMAPAFLETCVAALESHPEAAFVYTDYEMFGTETRVRRVPDYNLWDLVHRNTVCAFSLLRRTAWELAEGYDETNLGYEDWDLWLRLAGRGRYGLHLPRVLFYYRKHGRNLSREAFARHDELVAKIRARNPGLYSPESLARLRKKWGVQACVLSQEPGAGEAQSIADVAVFTGGVTRRALAATLAPAFVIPPRGRPPARQSAEQCALAVWSGRHIVSLPDGSIGLSRGALGRVRAGGRLSAELQLELQRKGWRREPEPTGEPAMILRYSAQREPGHRYTALLVPHLGWRTAVFEAAGVLRDAGEVFVVATDTGGGHGRQEWEQVADSVYDLAELAPATWRAFTLHALAAAWKFDTIVVAGSRLGYSMMPDLRQAAPGAKIVEIINAGAPDWSAALAAVSFHAAPDLRLVVRGRASQVTAVALAPDVFRRVGESLALPDLPGVELRFGGGLEATGLRFSHEAGLVSLELRWRCRERIGRPVRCFTEFVDAAGTTLASADHQILRDSPALTGWEPGDEGLEARQMVLPGGPPAGLQLRLSVFDDETGLRLPLQGSTAPLRDHYTAAVFEPNRPAATARCFAMRPGPRVPCEIEFETATLTGYAWSVEDGIAWLRLWWRTTGRVDQRLTFFGHAVAEASRAAPILTSFDQELRLDRLHSVPQELVYDVVRDVSGWTVPAEWLRAGLFDMARPLQRLRPRRSNPPFSQAETAVYLPL